MKKLLVKVMLLGIACLAYTHKGFAIQITDLNTYSPAQSVSHGSSFSDTFNLVPNGFVVGTDIATAGTVIFDLSPGTGNQGNYKVTIDLASSTVVNNGGLQDYTFTLSSGLLGTVNSTGQLGFTVSQNNSSVNFFVNSAELDVTVNRGANPNGQAAPDGISTAILLGASCLGLLGLRSLPQRKTATR